MVEKEHKTKKNDADNDFFKSPLPASFNQVGGGSQFNIQNQKASKQTSQRQKEVKPLLIGITGGTASGKTSLCDRITTAFAGKIALLGLDMFYKGLS